MAGFGKGFLHGYHDSRSGGECKLATITLLECYSVFLALNAYSGFQAETASIT